MKVLARFRLGAAGALVVCGCHAIFSFGKGPGDGSAPDAGQDDRTGGMDTAPDSRPAVDTRFDLASGPELVPAWSVHFTGVNADAVTGVAVDSAGSLYVTGYFMGQLAIGGTPCCSTATSMDLFLAKLSSGGVPLWVEHPGDTGVSMGARVLVDRAGDLRLVGNFNQSITLGGMKLTEYNPTVPQRDSFLATYRLAQPPQIVSAIPFAGPGHDLVDRIAQDAKGNLYLAGSFVQSLAFAGQTLTAPAGSTEVALIGLDENGAYRWSKAFGTPGMDAGTSLAVDGAGNVYLAGKVYASVPTLDFGGGPRPLIGEWDGFVASFDPSGMHRWSRVLGGPDSDEVGAVAVDAGGSVYLTGIAVGPVDFGDGKPQASQGADLFLVSYASSDGSHLWSRLLGGPQSDEGVALAPRPDGTLALAGDFAGTIDLGGGPLTASSGDSFVATFDTATGAHRWSTSFGGEDDSHVSDLAADAAGNLYLAGHFEGALKLGGASLVCPDASSDGFVLKLQPK